MKRVLITGAGLSGAVLARELAEMGIPSFVIDKNNHVAGQCHTARDPESGVLVHEFGPHIFNTNNLEVWNYVRKFDDFYPFVNRVKASNTRGVFSFPINLHTINQLFGKTLAPMEARDFIEEIRDKSFPDPQNVEEKLLSLVGRDIYEVFFKSYTTKQWGITPAELPPSVIKRIPLRFNYDDNYYNSVYQGIPMSGYTGMIERILDHELIEVKLNTLFDHSMADEFSHLFYSGPLDAYFGYREGRLSYRTVDFSKNVAYGDQQGNGVINYTEGNVPYTRVHQHDYFSPWEKHEQSVLVTETSRQTLPGDIPYYPIRSRHDRKMLEAYQQCIDETRGVSFVGRLGCYRYLDMQEVIWEAMQYARYWMQASTAGTEYTKTSAPLMVD